MIQPKGLGQCRIDLINWLVRKALCVLKNMDIAFLLKSGACTPSSQIWSFCIMNDPGYIVEQFLEYFFLSNKCRVDGQNGDGQIQV